MAGERSVRISFEAKEELSRVVQQVDKSLDQLKTSLGTLSAALETAEVSSDDTERSLDEVGDEAQQATVKVSTLAAALKSLEGTKFQGERAKFEVDVDEESIERGKMKVKKARQALIQQLERGDAEIDLDFDRDELLAKLKETEELADRQLDDIKIDPSLDESASAKLGQEVEATTNEVEAGVEDIKLNLNIPEGSKALTFAEVESFIETVEGLTDVDVNIDFDATDEAIQLAQLVAGMEAVNAAALKTAASTRAAASSVNKLGDESSDTAADMGVMASMANLASLNTTALSLNVGAFNIALSQLATQVPILIALLGTLTTVIIGLAGAVTLAATAFAGLLAGAFIAEVERLTNQFSNLESRAEAMQAIMRSLIDVSIRALQPLVEAGEEMNLMFSTINNALETANVFAKGIASAMKFSADQVSNFKKVASDMDLVSDEIMSISGFFDELGRIWQANVDDIISSTKIMSALLLPVLADIIEFFVAGFDDMIIFATHFTRELQAIGPAIEDLINFGVQLVDLGSTILQGLLPVFVGLLNIGTELASMFNQLNPQVIRTISGTAALALVTSKVVGAYKALAAAISEVIAGTLVETRLKIEQTRWSSALAGKTGTLATAKATLNAVTNDLIAAIKSSIIYKKLDAAATQLATIATWELTAASTALSASTGGLYTALGAVATALIAIVGAGAASVGVLGNMENVTSGLGSVLSTLKTVFVELADIFLDTFVSVWNSFALVIEGFMQIFWPLVNGLEQLGIQLGIASGETSALTSVWNGFKAVLDAVLFFIEANAAVLGKINFILGTLIGETLSLFIDQISFSISILTSLLTVIWDVIVALAEMVGMKDDVTGFAEGLSADFDQLIDTIMNLPSAFSAAFSAIASTVESFINTSIRQVNSLIKTANQIKGVDIKTFDTVDFGGPEGTGAVSKSDVVGGGGGGDAKDNVTGETANEFNYSEENVNEVAQEINADPEDTETLKRIVKDAMEEANSFTRRQEGGM